MAREIKDTTDSTYDVLIKGGSVYDGISSQPAMIDIGISVDKIVALGTLVGKAEKTIDAQGLTITPGFIDIHTHCDSTFMRLELSELPQATLPGLTGNYNYQFQGVSTVMTGNCGIGNPDLDNWFDQADKQKFGSNVYHLAPHGMLRMELFGEDQPRQLNKKQLEALKKRVAEEMEKGAAGLSTGLEYAPGMFAETSELIELAKVARKYQGFYVTHMRDETGRLYPNGKTGVENAIDEAIEIGKKAETSVEISHLKIDVPYNGRTASALLDPIEKARSQGLNIHADQYPYDAYSTHLAILLPNEFQDRIVFKKEDYNSKEGRQKIKKAIEHVFTYIGPEKIMIAMYPGKEKFEGNTIEEIAEKEKMAPSDLYVDMVCDEVLPFGIFFSLDESMVRDITGKDFIITSSDGWTVPRDITHPHPRAYGSFPRKLRKYVIDEKRLSLGSAIRSMTSLPAEVYNLKSRGVIKEGNFADITIIDLDKLTDKATYLKPHQYSEGITHLLINGVLAIDDGKTTGNSGGRRIRSK